MNVRRLSASTNMTDLNPVAKLYLSNIGEYDAHKKLGAVPLWCRYEGRRCIAAGPTRESVEPVGQLAAAG